MAINTKKRDRLTMAPTLSSDFEPVKRAADDEEEYERAVAFLRDFHSRRVAATATCLHSTALDAILEADRLDEVLSSEFSLALSVGRRPTVSTNDLLGIRDGKPVEEKKNNSFLSVIADVPSPSRSGKMRRTGGLSRMKKTATSKCLLDLDVGSSDGKPTSPIPRPVSPLDASGSDYYIDCEDAPVSKRRRSQQDR